MGHSTGFRSHPSRKVRGKNRAPAYLRRLIAIAAIMMDLLDFTGEVLI